MRDLNYQLKQLCTRNRDGSSDIRARPRFVVWLDLDVYVE
jgi:hypothetical protein